MRRRRWLDARHADCGSGFCRAVGPAAQGSSRPLCLSASGVMQSHLDWQSVVYRLASTFCTYPRPDA